MLTWGMCLNWDIGVRSRERGTDPERWKIAQRGSPLQRSGSPSALAVGYKGVMRVAAVQYKAIRGDLPASLSGLAALAREAAVDTDLLVLPAICAHQELLENVAAQVQWIYLNANNTGKEANVCTLMETCILVKFQNK